MVLNFVVILERRKSILPKAQPPGVTSSSVIIVLKWKVKMEIHAKQKEDKVQHDDVGIRGDSEAPFKRLKFRFCPHNYGKCQLQLYEKSPGNLSLSSAINPQKTVGKVLPHRSMILQEKGREGNWSMKRWEKYFIYANMLHNTFFSPFCILTSSVPQSTKYLMAIFFKMCEKGDIMENTAVKSKLGDVLRWRADICTGTCVLPLD